MNFLAFNFNKKIPKSGHFPSAVAWQWLTSLWSLRHFAPIPSSTNLGAGQQRQLNHGSNGGIEPGHTRHPTDSPTARLSCWAVVPIGPMMSRCRLVLVAGLDIVQTHPSPIVWRNNNTSSSWTTAIKSVLINSPDLPSITYSLTVIKLFPRNYRFFSPQIGDFSLHPSCPSGCCEAKLWQFALCPGDRQAVPKTQSPSSLPRKNSHLIAIS